jgi:Cu-Zn family superoxide dismutase
VKQAGNSLALRWLFPEKPEEEVPLRKITIPAAILTIGLAACGSPDTAEEPADGSIMETGAPTETAGSMQAVAMLQTAEGQSAGTATATASGEGIAISLEAEGLPEGDHGVHIHTTGSCEAPTFESAGDHWNPTNRQHGLENPEGSHAGDMPNLTVDGDGSGTLEYQIAGGTFDGLMDADGSAFVVHAMPDDQVTDPSGNSGDRIACGVFSAS